MVVAGERAPDLEQVLGLDGPVGLDDDRGEDVGLDDQIGGPRQLVHVHPHGRASLDPGGAADDSGDDEGEHERPEDGGQDTHGARLEGVGERRGPSPSVRAFSPLESHRRPSPDGRRARPSSENRFLIGLPARRSGAG